MMYKGTVATKKAQNMIESKEGNKGAIRTGKGYPQGKNIEPSNDVTKQQKKPEEKITNLKLSTNSFYKANKDLREFSPDQKYNMIGNLSSRNLRHHKPSNNFFHNEQVSQIFDLVIGSKCKKVEDDMKIIKEQWKQLYEGLVNQNEELKRQNNFLTESLRNMENQGKRNSQVARMDEQAKNKELKQLKQRNKSLQEEINQKINQLNKLNTENKRRETLCQELTNQNEMERFDRLARTKQLEQSMLQKEQQINARKEELNHFNKRIKQLNQEKLNLETDLCQFQKQIQRIKNDNNDLQNRNLLLKQQTECLKEEKIQLQRNLQYDQQQTKKIRVDLKQKSEKLIEVQYQKQIINEQLTSYQKQMNGLSQINMQLTQKISELQKNTKNHDINLRRNITELRLQLIVLQQQDKQNSQKAQKSQYQLTKLLAKYSEAEKKYLLEKQFAESLKTDLKQLQQARKQQRKVAECNLQLKKIIQQQQQHMSLQLQALKEHKKVAMKSLEISANQNQLLLAENQSLKCEQNQLHNVKIQLQSSKSTVQQMMLEIQELKNQQKNILKNFERQLDENTKEQVIQHLRHKLDKQIANKQDQQASQVSTITALNNEISSLKNKEREQQQKFIRVSKQFEQVKGNYLRLSKENEELKMLNKRIKQDEGNKSVSAFKNAYNKLHSMSKDKQK